MILSYPDWLNGDPPCVVIISLSLDDNRMGRRSDTRGTDSTTTIIQETDGLVNWWCCGFGCFVNRIYDNVVLLLLLLLAIQSVHSAEGGVTKLTLHWMAGRLLCKLLASGSLINSNHSKVLFMGSVSTFCHVLYRYDNGHFMMIKTISPVVN